MDQPARTRACRGDEIWTATGHERPVFLDEHGRRRRWVFLGGALAGGCSAAWLGALVAGAIGFSTMPSVQAHAPLLASRTALLAARDSSHARLLVRPGGRSAGARSAGARSAGARSAGARRRSKASPTERSSSLEPATELAVSRGLTGP